VSDGQGSEDETVAPARPAADAPPDPLLGRVLDDRFRLRARLGQGGMGAVYLADQPSVGREVAVKVIHGAHLGADLAEARSRFLREGRLTARLTSPFIVTVIDAGHTPDGLLYLAMERLHGRGLDRLITEEAPLPPARAVHLCLQIADALAAAHRAGVIHRDLKPSNVMVLAEPVGRDHVKVLDFGIARSLAGDHTTLTPLGDLFGTPAYVSPEMARGAPCGPRSDLYALGLVAYELLAGRRPFPAAPTALAAALQHLTETPAPLPDDVPVPLARVVFRLLAREPDDRYPSAEAAREALSAALPAAPDVPPSGPPRRRGTRRRLAVVGALVGFGGLLAVVFALRAGPAPIEAPAPVPPSSDATTIARPAPGRGIPAAPSTGAPARPSALEVPGVTPPGPSMSPTQAAPRPARPEHPKRRPAAPPTEAAPPPSSAPGPVESFIVPRAPGSPGP
jgi:serine/threonine-protein kinase